MDKINIGQRIRNQREKLGYSREVFAEKIKKSVKFCADIELGHVGISTDTLYLISKVLMISTDYILLGNSKTGADDEMVHLLRICRKDKVEELKTVMEILINSCEK